MKKKLALLMFAMLHLTLIILLSFDSTIGAYLEYKNDLKALKTNNFKENNSYKFLSILSQNKLVKYYLVFTGTDAGYGFFAPNVASSYIIKFEQFDEFNKKTGINYLPNLKTYEGLVRYNSLVNTFQDRMKALKTHRKTLYVRCLDVLLKSVGNGMYYDYKLPNTKNGIVTLSLYYTPTTLETGILQQKPKLFKILSINYNNLKNLKR